MSGLVLPDGRQQTTVQTMKLPMRNPEDPAAEFQFVLPTPVDSASAQMDTLAKTQIYVLNEIINLRVAMGVMVDEMKGLRADIARQERQRARSVPTGPKRG